jgi:hypothetical protein
MWIYRRMVIDRGVKRATIVSQDQALYTRNVHQRSNDVYWSRSHPFEVVKDAGEQAIESATCSQWCECPVDTRALQARIKHEA